MGNRMHERDFRKNMNMGQGQDNRSGRGPIHRGDFGSDRGYDNERHFNPREDMGGSAWSGYSGRGGMTDEQNFRSDGGEQSWQDRERSAWQNRNLHGQGREQAWQGSSQWQDRGERGGSYGQGTQGFSGSSGGGAYENRGFVGGRSTLGSENRGYAAGSQGQYGGMESRGYGSEPFGYAGGTDMGIGERASNRGPHFGKGPKGYKRSDDRIREEACEALYHQGHVDASDVEVKVTNGEVLLTGTVSDRRERREIEQMLDQIAGVDDVKNEIRVKKEDAGTTAGAGSRNGNLTGKESSAVQDRHGRS